MLNKALRALSRLRSGEAIADSLESYVDKWNEMTWRVLLLILAVGISGVIITRPELQQVIETWQGHTEVIAQAVAHLKTLSKSRLVFVHAVILFIVGASLLPLATGVEYWPFSHYRLYAGIQRPAYALQRFFGVLPNGDEIPLTPQHIYPFDEIRLAQALSRLQRRAQEHKGANKRHRMF